MLFTAGVKVLRGLGGSGVKYYLLPLLGVCLLPLLVISRSQEF